MANFNEIEGSLPKPTEEIFRQIVQHARVQDYKIFDQNDSGIVVECQWRVKLGSKDEIRGVTEKGVRGIEPVNWHIPFAFPLEPVLPSLRSDFPRNKFPHINPSSEQGEVWPCITETSVTSFLLANGLSRLLSQMDSWLDRAALDRLMIEDQGWEPIIFDNYGGNFKDLGNELISKAKDYAFNHVTGASKLKRKGSFFSFQNRPLFVSVTSEMDAPGLPSIDLLEIMLPESSASSSFQNTRVKDRQDLVAFAELLNGSPSVSSETIVLPDSELKVSEWLRITLDSLDRKYSQIKASIKENDAIGCIVVFCIPRPSAVIGGSSNIEVVPFFVRLASTQNSNAEVSPLLYIQDCSKEILQKVSREKKRDSKHLSFLGAGSVGSKIAISLARSGSYSLDIVDNGTLKPHNMARYGVSSIGRCDGWPKALLLSQTIQNYGVNSRCSFTDLSQEELQLNSSDLIIESTGNELVSYRLSVEERLPGRLCQVGLYGESAMGYLALEPSSKSRAVQIDDLEALMYWVSLSDSDVKSVLFNRKSAERQIVGHGCSSETTIMPDTDINLCCAAITDKIDRLIYWEETVSENGELHLCFRGEDSSIRWKSYQTSPTKEIAYKLDGRDWMLRVSGRAVEKMYRLREEKLPRETGGAIIGYICELTSRVYIVDALEPFPNSVESAEEFSFDQMQLHELDNELRETSQGRLYALGTWHSHAVPSSPSELDKKTQAELNKSLQLPVTTLLMCDGENVVVVES